MKLVPGIHAVVLVAAVAHWGFVPAEYARGSEGAAAADGDSRWAYLANADVRPVARPISLSVNRPEELAEEVEYRGSLQRYVQLRYGSENSRRVVLVIDELGQGEFRLFVDKDRDRRISKGEVVVGQGRSRTFALAAEIMRQGQLRQGMRRVRIRIGVTRDRLTVATLGCVEGETAWTAASDAAPDRVRVRRIDGNANGLFADSRDRLLIDLNGDGQWDPVTEQFPCRPVLTINDGRYAVRSDRMGRKFSLSAITGIGHLRVTMRRLPKSARILAFVAMVFSDDGCAYSLKQAEEAIEVPVGRYTLGSVTMTVDDGEQEPWHFVFSRGDVVGQDDWIDVATGQEASLEAVGELRFVLSTGGGEPYAGGDAISINPRIYTRDGLLINLSCRGSQISRFDRERSHNRCRLILTSPSGETLTSAQSGFS